MRAPKSLPRRINSLTQNYSRPVVRLIERYRYWKLKGINNVVEIHGVTSNTHIVIIGNNNSILIKNEALISNVSIFMRGSNNRLVVGRGVKYSGGSLRFEGENCVIEVGDGTTVTSASLQAIESNRQITVGKNCMFSLGIEVWTSDFHSIIDNESQQRINAAADIVIEDHVWVGAYALILKGVRLGKNSIIAARSTVTKDVPCNVVAAGSPAKVIRTGINWNRDKDLS